MLKVRHFSIPVFIPELSCPFQCVFCNQQKISGRQTIPDQKDVTDIIESYLKTLPLENSHIEAAFFGGNFTGIPMDMQRMYLEAAYPYVEKGIIKGIRLSTRPDYITPQKLDLLKEYGVTVIELGAQSYDDEVLIKSGRGHKAADITAAAGLINRYGFELGLQMMIGLPGDTLEKALYTAGKIIEAGAKNTRIYPALVIKDTAMEKLYYKGKYKPLSLNEAVEWAKEILPLFESAGVNVIRTGLHPSEGLLSGSELIAGPFHISFKELVLSRIWGEKFNEAVRGLNCEKIEIKVPPAELNHAVGYGSVNKKKLQERFKEVKFLADSALNKGEFNVIYC